MKNPNRLRLERNDKMKLNFNFSGKTLLKDWWKIVRDNFTAIQTDHNTLSNKLDTEITQRTNADVGLADKITAETKARESTDNTLQGNIDAEAKNRRVGDTKKDATIGSCLYLQTTELVGNIQQPAIRFKNKDGEVIFEISVTEDGCLRFIPILGTGKVLLGNTEAASKDDIQKLQSDIKGLADRISALEKA